MSSSHSRGPDIQKTLKNFQPNTSVLKIFEDCLRRNGDNVAMVEGETGKRISFSQLLQHSSSIAAGLVQAGVSSGDVVVLYCDKSIMAYSLLLGTMFTGATAVLTHPSHTDTIDKIIPGEVVKALFYDSALNESVSQSVARMTPPPSLIAKADLGDPIIAKFLKSTQKFTVFQVEDITKHVPVVFFSSGTTGHPKAIQISDLGVQLAGVHFTHKSDSLLVPSPLYWYSALFTFVGSALNNYTLILTDSKDPRDRLQLIEKYKVDSIFASLVNMIQYINEPTTDNFDLSSVKYVISGGEIIISSVARQFVSQVMKGQATLDIVYGTTEAGFISNLEVQDVDSLRLGAVGKPKPGVEVKILDDEGHPVEFGVMGRIWVKSLATKGYWRKEELNRDLLDGEGFYETGDAGFLDTEGVIHLRGRICDLINFRGTKSSATVVEDLLMDHPAVQAVAVVGKPHAEDVQRPTAYVVLRPESKGTITDCDLVAYVDDRVEDKMKLRGGVHFRDSLPRKSSGKVIRKML